MSFLDQLDQLEQEASSGGGIIGRINFEIGEKCFVAGVGNEESFFSFQPGNPESKEAALAQAKELISNSGGGFRHSVAVQFRVYRDQVLGREVNWMGDRFFTHPLWTDGYKHVVKPALAEIGVENVGEYWGRISFAPDPSGRMEKDQDGNDRVAMLGFLAEVYDSEEAAQQAAGAFASSTASSTPSSDPSIPAGWTVDGWNSVKPEIAKELAAGKTIPDVAKAYGVEPRFVSQASS